MVLWIEQSSYRRIEKIHINWKDELHITVSDFCSKEHATDLANKMISGEGLFAILDEGNGRKRSTYKVSNIHWKVTETEFVLVPVKNGNRGRGEHVREKE